MMDTLSIVTRNTPRLHTTRHAKLMRGLVGWLQPENIVEVGAWAGFCSVHLATALEENGKGHLWVIDDYSLGTGSTQIHNLFQEAGVAHRLTIIQGKSTEVQWPARVDFAFIDGDHSLEGCLHDCNQAIERGATCVCIHDTQSWWGPKQYLELFRRDAGDEWDVMECQFDQGFTVLKRREPEIPVYHSEQDYPNGHV